MSYRSKYTGAMLDAALDLARTALQEHQDISGKQDKIEDLQAIREGAAKGATALQSVPSDYVKEDKLNESLEKKVDKVEGKQLSTEDFTTLLKQKLDGLSNYDDTAIQESVTKLRTDLDTLVSGDTTTAIKTFNEVIAFLEGLEDTEDLASIIASIEMQIASKMDTSVAESTFIKIGEVSKGANVGMQDANDEVEDVNTQPFVKYVVQVLTEGQKEQAKKNLGIDLTPYATKKEVSEEFDKVYSTLGAMDNLYYGIEFDTSVPTNDIVRIGNLSFHRSLPIHEKMKGCLLDDNGDVVKYLDKNSWIEETRDGSMGQVMVEIPDIYWRFEEEGTKRRAMISTLPLPGFFLVPKCYVSAYEASVQRSTTTLCSVVNSDADYRGGNNNTSYDGTYRSLLGRPATSISRTNFRNYARKRKEGSTEWNCMTYDVHKWIYWLFVIEYATLNSQAAYNAELDANGYRQGGLGDGVTTWDGTSWNNFNGYNPFVPCGHTDSLGNGTGTVSYEVLDAEGTVLKTINVSRYRGIENPFGHIWQWTDGVNVRISPTVENGGDGLSKVFVCSDPSKFSDTGYEGYEHVGNLARTEGYGKRHIFGEYGEIIPDAVGGGSTTYLCDYHYTNIPTSETLRGLLFGGSAHNGATAGFAAASLHNAPSNTHAHIGSRLCFIPNKKTE